MSRNERSPAAKRKTFFLLARLYNDSLRRHLWPLIASFACMFAIAAMASAYTYLMGPLVDKVFIGKDMTFIWLVGGAVVAIFVVRSLASYVQGVMLIALGQKIVLDLQKSLLGSLLKQDVSLFSVFPPAKLIGRFTYDVNLLRTNICNFFLRVGKDTMTIWGMIVLMFVTDWQMAALCLAGLPLSLVCIVFLNHWLRDVSLRAQAEVGKLNTTIMESLSNLTLIKAYGLEDVRHKQVTEHAGQAARLITRVTAIQAAILPVFDGLGGVAIAGMIVYGGAQVLAHDLTPGTFMIFVGAVYNAYQPLRSLARVNVDLQTGLAAAERVFEVMDRPSTLLVSDAAPDLARVAGSIRLEGVQFTYPEGGHAALRGVDIVAPAGQVTALVGRSGAGKSTVLSLISRFYDPDQGRVLVNGQDVRAVNPGSLRQSIAVVDQSVALFDDTIAGNIRLGRLEATDEQVVAAARAAGVDGFAALLPEGLQTRVGEGGVGLSEGQAQRITIARAFLRDAPILLFDEVTSAQDAESEQHIRRSMATLMQGRTTLIITHRLETVRHADLVYVMDEGRVVESGTPEELMARGGLFANMHAIQFEGAKALARTTAPSVLQDEVQ